MSNTVGGATFGTLAELVEVHGRDRRDQPCVASVTRALTYGEIDERASRAARALTASGVGPGDRVVYLGKNCVEYFELLFGAAKAGAVFVPVNWRLTTVELAAIIGDAGAPLVVAGAGFGELAAEVGRTMVQPPRTIGVEDELDGPTFGGWLASAPETAAGTAPGPSVGKPTDVALQLYTSGTTGTPKGVLLTNQALLGRAPGVGDAYELSMHSVAQVSMPLFHVGGIGWALLSLHQGTPLVVEADVRLEALLDDIVAFGVTHTFAVPTVLKLLLDALEQNPRPLPSLEVIVYGAAPMSPELLARARDRLGCRFAQSYGLTEAAGGITVLRPDEHDAGDPKRLASCGRAMPWVELVVTDAESGVPLAPGEVGQIRTRSFQNMVGYWRRPEETATVLSADGWLCTGDLGHLDEEGYLFLHDRMSDMIVTGGENVYPDEVERAILMHPSVAEAAVVGTTHPTWGETVSAFVVAAPGAAVEPTTIIEHTRARLAPFKCPTAVHVVDELPRNAAGKVLRRALRNGMPPEGTGA